MNNMIFGIGLPKTGTKSLISFLQKEGFNGMHHPTSFDQISELESRGSTAFADIFVTINYRELDRIYPNSKFILTTRDLESWHKSCKKHFNEPKNSIFREQLFKMNKYDFELFDDCYKKHHNEVMKFFQNRNDDIFVFDISNITSESIYNLHNFLGIKYTDDIAFTNFEKEKVDIVLMFSNGVEGCEYSIESWKRWCKKFDHNFYNCDERFVSGFKSGWEKFVAFELIENEGINCNSVLLLNGNTIVHSSCPDMLLGKFNIPLNLAIFFSENDISSFFGKLKVSLKSGDSIGYEFGSKIMNTDILILDKNYTSAAFQELLKYTHSDFRELFGNISTKFEKISSVYGEHFDIYNLIKKIEENNDFDCSEFFFNFTFWPFCKRQNQYIKYEDLKSSDFEETKIINLNNFYNLNYINSYDDFNKIKNETHIMNFGRLISEKKNKLMKKIYEEIYN